MPAWLHTRGRIHSSRTRKVRADTRWGAGKGSLMPENNQEKTFTQEELNAIVADRLARERGKYADYDDLKRDAEAYRARQEADKTELQKAQERIAELEAEQGERKRKDEHAALVRKVMEAQKVDARYASLLTADTEEALTEQAKLIGERFADPVPREGGKPPQVGDKDAEMKAFAHQLFGGGAQ